MDEEKKTLGRAKIYTGEPESQVNDRTRNDAGTQQTSAARTNVRTSEKTSARVSAESDTQSASTGDRRARRAEPIGTKPKEHLAVEPGRRRKDIETDAKMRRLWALLGILVVILVVAIVYEIVLGHVNVETGSQRMNQAVQETEQIKETELPVETEQESGTASETEISADADAGSGDGGSADADASDADGNSADIGSGDGSSADADGSSADAEAADGTTLAGLDD